MSYFILDHVVHLVELFIAIVIGKKLAEITLAKIDERRAGNGSK